MNMLYGVMIIHSRRHWLFLKVVRNDFIILFLNTEVVKNYLSRNSLSVLARGGLLLAQDVASSDCTDIIICWNKFWSVYIAPLVHFYVDALKIPPAKNRVKSNENVPGFCIFIQAKARERKLCKGNNIEEE